MTETPCLMLAPPFQIQGDVPLAAGSRPGAGAADARSAGFFAVSDARVYDADGYLLGEGEQIVVNGARRPDGRPDDAHIEAFVEKAGAARRATVREPDDRAATIEDEAVTRAA